MAGDRTALVYFDLRPVNNHCSPSSFTGMRKLLQEPSYYSRFEQHWLKTQPASCRPWQNNTRKRFRLYPSQSVSLGQESTNCRSRHNEPRKERPPLLASTTKSARLEFRYSLALIARSDAGEWRIAALFCIAPRYHYMLLTNATGSDVHR